MNRVVSLVSIGLAAAALSACGSSGSSPHSSDAGADARREASADAPGGSDSGSSDGEVQDGPFVPAAHAPFPLEVYQGGGILTAPQLVTVTFPGDPMETDLVNFGKTLQASSWWSAVTGGYCEGKGGACVSTATNATSVVYPTAPGASYSDTTTGGGSSLKSWLESGVMSGALPAPQSGTLSNTLYVVYFPASTTITLNGTTSCTDFYGYHGSFTNGSQQVPYAVVVECSGAAAGENPPITTLQNTTITASHEILEAVTDPSDLSTGYYLNLYDPGIYGWNDLEGGEAADMCVDIFYLGQDEATEGPYTVQRIWSNAQAMAGGDPCAPVPAGEVYFNAAPVRSFFVMDVGSTITFEVDAFSTGPRPDWKVGVVDYSLSQSYLTMSIVGGTVDATLAGTWGVQSLTGANNGAKIQVKMTLTADPAVDGEADGAIVNFTGELTGAPATYWAFSVMTPSDAMRYGVDASLTPGRKTLGRRAPMRAERAGASLLPRPWRERFRSHPARY